MSVSSGSGAGDELDRSEIEAALETRRELGLRYDRELVEGFAERIEREVERRVGDELAVVRRRDAALAGAGARQLALAIISLVTFIPTGIPLGLQGDIVALMLVLSAVVAVNVAHAWQSRR